jgi:hypothetical protein
MGSQRAIDADHWARRFLIAGRITLNFHPDRVCAARSTVAASLLSDGRYRSQWVTGISNGGRSAVRGGERHRWEGQLFDDAYDSAPPGSVEYPVYGAFDLLHDPNGDSPRFGHFDRVSK